MKYIIPQEYRVQSREDYMANFWIEQAYSWGYSDGERDGRIGFAFETITESEQYQQGYAAGSEQGIQDYRHQ